MTNLKASEIPEVSVLMSVHNGGRYLSQAVASILEQTLHNLEMIVTDDASTDDIPAVLGPIAAQDARLHVIRSERRMGQAAGLNMGLSIARSEWVAILDADDVAVPNRLESQLAFTRQHPGLKACGCLVYYIDTLGRRIGRSAHDLSTEEVYDRYMREGEAIGFCHSGAFIRRAAIVQLGGYRSEFEPANDSELWNRIAELGPVLVQQEYLVEYRVHPTSLTATSFKQMRLKYEWIRNCKSARRNGVREPGWKEFLHNWGRAPWYVRINRWRKMNSKRLYRQAALHYTYGSTARAVASYLISLLLQPSYAIPHLSEQHRW